MGTRCAPNFANLYMASLEEFFLNQELAAGRPIPTVGTRYIDAILVIWEHSQEALNTFTNNLNQLYQQIKFTIDDSPNNTIFLDLNIFKGPNFNQTNLLDFEPYRKKCHKISYLHYQSCHPKHHFKGIARGEAIRTLRNSSNIDIYEKYNTVVFQAFNSREYPAKLLREATADLFFADRNRWIYRKKPQTFKV